MTSESREAEAELADAIPREADCRSLLDLMRDPVVIHDVATGAIVDANLAAQELFGLGHDDLCAASSDRLLPDAARDALGYVRRAASGEPQLFEHRARRRSGEPFWLEVSLSRVRCSGTERLVAVLRDVTARKRVEDALRASEDRARRKAEEASAALEEARRADAERSLAVDVLERGDAVIVLDAAFRIVLVNEDQERLSRRSREECVGRVIWDVFPEGANPDARFREVFERVMRERVPERFEEYYAPLDMWTSVSVYPTRRGGIAVFVRDVSEHKRAEQALRAQEDFSSRILASSLNGIYVIDLDAEEPAFVNARYTQLTGYTFEDLRAMRGELLERLFHPDDRERMRRHHAALRRARDGEVLDIEYRFRVRDGRWTSIFSRETPFSRGADGRVRQLIGTFVDLTELRRAQEAARESEVLYRALFESMAEGFALFEMVGEGDGPPNDCRFVEVNGAFERLTGLRRARVVGRLLGAVAPKEKDYWVRAYGEVAVTGAPVRVEHRSTVVARDYEVYAFSPRARHLAVTFVDVTDRKRVEHELRDLDRRKNEFLSLLSHELRNPLAPIRNSLHLLDHAPPGGPQAARARRVLVRQTEHLTKLVDDLLDVTRISRGKILLQRSRLDARDALLRTSEDHRSLFEEAGIALRIEVPPAPAWVEADATRLSQVIGNLLQNAVKFTPRGGSVAVEAATAGGWLEIHVRDTGLGVAPGDTGRIFEPFAQAGESLARAHGGLGLGLALVKGLVELHGGTVAVRSDGPGRGTEFTVRLPLLAQGEEPGPASGTGREPPAGVRRRRRVLVVDDNRDAAETLAELLRLEGHEVEVASDGASALERVRRTAPDAVLCDIGLPGMSGYEVAKAIRAEAGSAVQLVAVSGYAQPEDLKRAIEAGFDAHVAKPPDLGKLERLLA
jgi:PAS domain S-box-containing protein